RRSPGTRRADGDARDAPAGQQIGVLRVAGDAAVRPVALLRVEVVDELPAVFDALRVEIADRHDAGDVVAQDVRQVVPARNAADADCADVDPVAGRRRAEDA